MYFQGEVHHKLKSRYFSLQPDESTLRESDVVLLVYARYIDKGEFAEEMVSCKSLETTTSAADMYATQLKNWLFYVDSIALFISTRAPLKYFDVFSSDITPTTDGCEKNITPPESRIFPSVIRCVRGNRLRPNCQVIYSQFALAIHQNDYQARRRFVEWAQNEIAVVPDFHKRILFSDEAHFWLNGYVNKQNCRIWSEANPQVYVETPLHPEKLTVWCALWAGGILLQKR
ncbi:SCAN domain-containing protein 3 [Trichonephila clavipes]|nr:SCAN domain-containing protein 3 [Trichonephila clavipes]